MKFNNLSKKFERKKNSWTIFFFVFNFNKLNNNYNKKGAK